MKLIWKKLENTNAHDTGRKLLKDLYWEVTGQSLPPIEKTPRGKPYFADSPWHFSISHTKRHVFCCLSRKNIGIDAEEMDRRVDPRLAERYLSPVEKSRLAASEDQNAALLRLWVQKEAYAKLTGAGIGNYLKTTDFDPENQEILCIDGCYVAVLEGE